MSHDAQRLEYAVPVGNAEQAASESASAALLHAQIYRYAEDLQQMIERHEALQSEVEAVRQTDAQLTESRALLDALTRHSHDIHLVTDTAGIIVNSNLAAVVLAPAQRMVGTPLQDWVLPSHHDNFLALSASANEHGMEISQGMAGQQRSNDGVEWELSLRRAGNALPPLIVLARQIALAPQVGEARRLHWVFRDVTHLRAHSKTEVLEAKLSLMVFNNAAESMMITDAEGVILAVNPAFIRLTGYSPEEVMGRNTHFLGSGLQDADLLDADFWRALYDSGHWQGEMLQSRKNGEAHSVWLTIKAERDASGRTLSFLAVFSDLPHQLQAERRVLITDPDGIIIAVNRAFTRHTGYTALDTLGCNPRFHSSGLQNNAFYTDFWRSLKDTGKWQGELFNRKKNGEIYAEWLTINATRDASGSIVSYVAVCSDIPSLVNAQHHLSYAAHHDVLTGLPNRLLFQDRLAQALAQSRRSNEPFTLIFIDLDRFKQINDTLGHAVGDRVLQEAARRLSSVLREVDTVARLGGDEFVVIAPGLVGDAFIGRLCIKAIDLLRQPIRVIGQEVSVGSSLGCAEYPRHGSDEVALLQRADTAMYQAKAAGGNTYVISDAPSTLLGESHEYRLESRSFVRAHDPSSRA